MIQTYYIKTFLDKNEENCLYYCVHVHWVQFLKVDFFRHLLVTIPCLTLLPELHNINNIIILQIQQSTYLFLFSTSSLLNLSELGPGWPGDLPGLEPRCARW